MKSLFNSIFQKRMFIVILTSYILFHLISKKDEIGINKTVGWAFDFYVNMSPIIYIFLFYIFFIIYSIIALCKWKTNKILSIIHFGIILISITLFEINNPTVLQICNFCSLTFFLTNIFWSFTKRKSH
ncbi:MAG: hypothetical protein RLY43_1105 [Bacteroidota bacterium]